MNLLWVRLSLAFAAIIIISFGTISYTARRYFNDSNLRSLALSYFTRPSGLIDQLEEYYDGHESWQGVSLLMEGADSALFFNATNRTVLVLTDPEGHVLYATAGTDRPNRLEASQLQQSLPISVEGRTVGFLDLIRREQPSECLFTFSTPDDISPGFAERASEFLLQVLLIGAVLAIVFGMLVSRWLSAPQHVERYCPRTTHAPHCSGRQSAGNSGRCLSSRKSGNCPLVRSDPPFARAGGRSAVIGAGGRAPVAAAAQSQ